jgi:hypothetical protein
MQKHKGKPLHPLGPRSELCHDNAWQSLAGVLWRVIANIDPARNAARRCQRATPTKSFVFPDPASSDRAIVLAGTSCATPRA